MFYKEVRVVPRGKINRLTDRQQTDRHRYVIQKVKQTQTDGMIYALIISRNISALSEFSRFLSSFCTPNVDDANRALL